MTNKLAVENINLDALKFDNFAPRMPQSFHCQKTDVEMIDYLLLETSLVELMLAIGENDFFLGEQLWVVFDEIDKKYTVIDGNRRLAAVRLLNDPSLATVKANKVNKVFNEIAYRPDSIPCLVFPTRGEILKHLGYRHITGVQSWKIFEKARYVSQLKTELFPKDELGFATRKIAKIIGSRMDYVRRLLVGFGIYKFIKEEGFFQIPDLNNTSFHFSYIIDSLNWAHITEFLGIDFSLSIPDVNQNEAHIQEWVNWFFKKNNQNQTRLKSKSDDLNMLSEVLINNKARQSFRDGSSLLISYRLTSGR